MNICSERLTITDLSMNMCRDYQRNSVDEDNRKFVPDEVCETLEDAERTLKWLIKAGRTPDGPFVYPVITKDSKNIGYVQACPIEEGFEIGYHIAKEYTGNGYATEAVRAFLPFIMKKLQIDSIYGIVLEENKASHRVLEKCGFKMIYCGEGNYQGVSRALKKYVYKIQNETLSVHDDRNR